MQVLVNQENQVNCLNQVNHLGSEKYRFISSNEIKTRLEFNGMTFSHLVENKIRKNKEKRQGYQKHTMIFDTGISTDDGKLQLLVTNSHEGSSSLQFRLGFYRLICDNGLIVGTNVIPLIRVNHTEKGLSELDEKIAAVLNYADNALKSINLMKSKELSHDEINSFYSNVLKLRLPEKEVDGYKIEAARIDDDKTDLFTVFNVAQERLLRTGFKATIDGKERKIRAITGHKQRIKVNQDLWDMAFKLVA